MAPVLGVTARTLENRFHQKQFRDVIDRGVAKRKITIRQQLMKRLREGNVPVLIHLSKVDLGQMERHAPEIGHQLSTETINALLRRVKKQS